MFFLYHTCEEFNVNKVWSGGGGGGGDGGGVGVVRVPTGNVQEMSQAGGGGGGGRGGTDCLPCEEKESRCFFHQLVCSFNFYL